MTIHFQVSSIAHEEIHIEGAPPILIHITRNGRNEATYIARTAGTSEPWLALMLPHGLKGIGIEERTSVKRHTGDDTVVESTLQDVVILRLAVKEEQTMVDIHLSDSCARLTISRHIGKFPVASESLTA